MKKNGFTLVEMIVALAVFGIVISIAINSFVSTLKVQRKALAMQEAQNSLRYALESMSREARMSHIEADSVEDVLHIFAFRESGLDVVYSLSAGKIMRNSAQGNAPLTSDSVNITRLKFYINDENTPPAIVTIAISAETTGEYAGQGIDLQTTISARDYD